MALLRDDRQRDAAGLLPVIAGVLGALGVVLGAGVAHGLAGWLQDQGMDPATIPRRVAQADTAVRYHLIHSVVLLVLFSLRDSLGRRSTIAAGWLITVGILLFSGSLYALVLWDQPKFGAITPLGGLVWVVGWLLIAVAGFRSWRRS